MRRGQAQGIAKRRPEGPRQDVRGPEDHALRDLGQEVREGHEREQGGELERAALESDAGGRRDEIAERGAERDLEDLVWPRGDVLELDPSREAVPDEEDDENAAEQDDR